MLKRFENRVVMITGGTSGIGEASFCRADRSLRFISF